ncbi:FAD-dependent monooxygenase [Actinophytocola oryzae]|uniref:2-polyprenyl-6-methoxyphenol hydroxylase-like FAD-dependent oxidoreductase n=1 Tax=Actinophytocola oryzae TaxID=502181 RepID=A0A4R7VV78_9PSEU|nr:FAD-dependent monooxygenase [Actinophytocola oryzae]TDV53916.1 2-polyprenyl-6-methoxyphenol hydroxylase-like FAD-dependent oxidoreductase [Actinophytocola oryzae]
MKNTTVLISGASIAGPALALWLARYGATVTVVERTPFLRAGGQAVDFKGETHHAVLTRMGILDEVVRRQTGGHDQTVVDAQGRPQTVIPGEFTGGDIEIRRGDLAQILYERTRDSCEYVFGDSITSLTESEGGVHVTFERGAPRTFDLVVGADGIHSNVRRLAFGPEKDYVRYLGHYYALANLDVPGGEALMYNEPGRMVALGGPKAESFFVFASPELSYDRYDVDQQQKLLVDAYRGGAWRIPELLPKVPGSPDFYMDTISRVDMNGFTKGRVVLLGDSAYGNTLGGFGTGLAIVGAYVLAGELYRSGGDHVTAFRRYDELMQPYAKVAKKTNAGPFLAPGSPRAIRMRNWTFKYVTLFSLMMKLTDRFATKIDLPDY